MYVGKYISSQTTLQQINRRLSWQTERGVHDEVSQGGLEATQVHFSRGCRCTVCIVDPLTVCVGQRCRWGCNRLLMRAACIKDPPRRRDYFSVVSSVEALLRCGRYLQTHFQLTIRQSRLVFQFWHINIAQVHVGSRSGRQDVDSQGRPPSDPRVSLPRGRSQRVAKREFNLAKHSAIDTKNLFVIKACQSPTSREYLKTRFSAQYYYYVDLTRARIMCTVDIDHGYQRLIRQ